MLLQNQISTDSINNPIIEEKTLSIIELISSGGIGGNIIMGTLGVLSIYAIYILFERFSTIKKASFEDESFLKSIKNFVEQKDIQAAQMFGDYLGGLTEADFAKTALGEDWQDIEAGDIDYGDLAEGGGKP